MRLPADSSSSSQSSGYGSANFNNQSRQQMQRPLSQEDALAARPPRPTTLFQQRKRSGSRNHEGALTLEDSQMI